MASESVRRRAERRSESKRERANKRSESEKRGRSKKINSGGGSELKLKGARARAN